MNHDECQLVALALPLLYLGWIMWLFFKYSKRDSDK